MIRALLETSSEPDAATVLLREVFGVDYRRLAELSGRTEPACRQAVRRALARARERERHRDRDGAGRPGRATRAVADAVPERFARSVLAGEPATLLDALRIDADDRGRVESVGSAGPCCRTRVAVGGAGVRLELMLGGVVLCELAPRRRPHGLTPGRPTVATP